MIFVFVAVVGARFLLPLTIPRYPLPGIIACLVLDGIDQSIFQAFGYDPPGYQSYDKAMDVFYLAIAYLTTLRNWTSRPGFAVGRFLYFYRLVGVVAFELAQVRALLLVFPNTFEYYFIAYETVRSRWNPVRLLFATWVLVAAAIWIFVKLPQEYWIHVAQLDVTDTLAEYSWAWPLLVTLLLGLAAILWFVVRPRTPEPDWPIRVAADPLPEEMDEGVERAAWHAEHTRVWSWATFEKVALVSLLSVIFAQTVPGVRASNLELAVGIGLLVVVNAAISLATARRSMTLESAAAVFATRLATNIGLVLVANWLIGPADVNLSGSIFFLVMLSLLTSLHDRWLPIRATRDAAAAAREPT
ncbi:hypothetical protein [Nocardioides sp.]|uniref:hypothetical protein n=1 Tax=Nocardioides sp. TaxID=35761 RepID=UPI002ED6B4EA